MSVATLLYGDGTITPAISVLSAIEGLKIYAPQMSRAVVPLTVVILVILFLIQRKGTSFVGGIFGPVMLVWFIVAGVLGVVGIVRTPTILTALSPLPAVTYFWHAGPLALVVIGGAFLAVTGGEAFYADMGHFGPIPIRIAWFGVALPALTLNYFGQGGLLLAEPNSPEVIDSPFYALAPQWSHYPLVVLATVATVIASQSIISGAYSMTQQAISLGFLPRMKVVHTEGREIGQIYVPFVQLGACRQQHTRGRHRLRLVGRAGWRVRHRRVATDGDHHAVGDLRGAALEAQSADRVPACGQRQPSRPRPALLRLDLDQALRRWLVPPADRLRHLVPHVDLAQGRGGHGRGSAGDTPAFEGVHRRAPARPAASYSRHGHRTRPRGQRCAARALAQRQSHNRVLHDHVLLVAVTTTEVPRMPGEDRIVVTPLSEGLARVELRFGFMEEPNVPEALAVAAIARGQIETFDLTRVIYYTGHETIIPSGRRPGLPRWREALFALMHHNAQRPGAYFKIPGGQIMEIGVEFEI